MPLSKESIGRAYQAFARSADADIIVQDLDAQFGAASKPPAEPDRYGRFIGGLEVVAYLKAMMEGKND